MSICLCYIRSDAFFLPLRKSGEPTPPLLRLGVVVDVVEAVGHKNKTKFQSLNKLFKRMPRYSTAIIFIFAPTAEPYLVWCGISKDPKRHEGRKRGNGEELTT